MAYFLKKTTNKKGVYLQIYESFYDPERGHTAHKSFKPIGYVHELQAKGIEDPISFYQEEVFKLNQKFQAAKKAKKARQISDESPEKLLGYFPMKNIKKHLRLLLLRYNIVIILHSANLVNCLSPKSQKPEWHRNSPAS